MHGKVSKKPSKNFRVLNSWFYSQADLPEPEKKMISPDFLFEHAREYQVRVTELQSKINEAIQEVQVVVSRVLKVSTAETLNQYQHHLIDIEFEYAPHIEALEQLDSGDCKNTAETIINSVRNFTGFNAGNCAYEYDQSVQNKIADASNSLVRYDNIFSQIQLIVVKGFVGANPFVTPEAIDNKIAEIIEIGKRITSDATFDSENFTNNLASEIAEENSELGNCHNAILEVAKSQDAWFRQIIQTCSSYDDASQGKARRMGRTVEPYIQLFADFQEQFKNLKFYEWKA